MARILVIDDESEVREMLGDMLTREGYEVELAADGKEGVDRFCSSPADVVITDILMPEKEGIETIIEMQGSVSDVKIIVMSGGGRIGAGSLLEMAGRLGARYTFAKPFDRKEMLEAVRELTEAA